MMNVLKYEVVDAVLSVRVEEIKCKMFSMAIWSMLSGACDSDVG